MSNRTSNLFFLGGALVLGPVSWTVFVFRVCLIEGDAADLQVSNRYLKPLNNSAGILRQRVKATITTFCAFAGPIYVCGAEPGDVLQVGLGVSGPKPEKLTESPCVSCFLCSHAVQQCITRWHGG